jgi:hypothetical protein
MGEGVLRWAVLGERERAQRTGQRRRECSRGGAPKTHLEEMREEEGGRLGLGAERLRGRLQMCCRQREQRARRILLPTLIYY